MVFLSALAGDPHKCAPSIHIAGSKGKGSVTGMLCAILTEAGFHPARYMSPHVIDIRERICLGDKYFDEETYRAAGDEARRVAEELLPAAGNPLFATSTDESEPTYWELLTLLFFLCARLARCDVMVTETGMGGRLDSTNILDPLASVITLIEIEHANILGDTITAIAGEKAGIIKQGKPLVLARQSGEVFEVFRKKAEEKNSRLYYLPDIADISNVKISVHGTEFSLSIANSSILLPHSSFSIPVPGKVQAENAALAIAAVKIAFPQIGINTIRRGLKNLKIPARFENIALPGMPPFIVDGAHTPESLSLCIETFCFLYSEGGILIFGCAADKDAAAMARIAHSHFSRIIVTTPGTFKSSNPSLVYETFVRETGREKTTLIENTQEAVKLAENMAVGNSTITSRKDAENEREKTALPVLGTGSFYLVSEIRKILLKNTATL
ncbi:MAG: Mur ligase family protein [Treponema sp.]|nr:Mur ligase family protein [Treponema sp.]MCL2272644.1 Mur ligase family protein [Treponema sp.]